MKGSELDTNVFSWRDVIGISIDIKKIRELIQKSACFRETDIVGGSWRKNDLETAVRKEIASFLNNKNFYVT